MGVLLLDLDKMRSSIGYSASLEPAEISRLANKYGMTSTHLGAQASFFFSRTNILTLWGNY